MRSPMAVLARGDETSSRGYGDPGGAGPGKLLQDRPCLEIGGSCGRSHGSDGSCPDAEQRKENRRHDRRRGSTKVGVGDVARGSRRGHRERADPLCHSPRVLKVNILGSDSDIKQCGLDVRMSHQLH
jgi:hypothetical protein